MSLNREDLKKTAELFRKGMPKDSLTTAPRVDAVEVQKHVDQLEQHVLEFAANGHMAVDYNFKEEFVDLRTPVAKAFKQKNPQLFVMESAGTNKITVTWDGNNYV
jgi:hypothetical protein